jgi:regulator of sigma E protease
MSQLLNTLSGAPDLLMVILGFGFIIFVHELGHFVAAKWAGIRVLAFAIGFGPAICSYRKGLGLRPGSSETEYKARLKADGAGERGWTRSGIAPTEYRLNWLPLGGYVKMLGQEDMDPTAVSTEKDSYQNTPVPKRMVVISAGVVMNIILAGLLFVIVFMQGLKTEPPKIGAVGPGTPAAQAVPLEGGEPGLKAGDTVIAVNGRKAEEFTDLALASAMARRGDTVELVVQRAGRERPLTFLVTPRENRITKLQEIGLAPFASPVLVEIKGEKALKEFHDLTPKLGIEGVEPGATLVSVNGRPAQSADDLIRAAEESHGAPVAAVFKNADGAVVEKSIQPVPDLQEGHLPGSTEPQSHLLGLMPVMTVDPGLDKPVQGLHAGDVIARVGAVEFPSFAQARAEINARKGSRIEIDVIRKDAQGRPERISLDPSPRVRADGSVGFPAASTADDDTIVALPAPLMAAADRPDDKGRPPAARTLITRPGTRILSVAGEKVSNLREVREALRRATTKAAAAGGGAAVSVDLALPLPDQPGGAKATETKDWDLSPDDVRTLQALGWSSPIGVGAFRPEEYVLQAKNPADAMRMGLARTKRVMLTTYLTFARLFEGTVKVEHLKGPVGIAHLGTQLADRGLIWLLFFMALISVNLAVINFLPLPIVDGGQFLFLVLEGIRGRPVPVSIQNAATIAGLVLIGTVFLIVTFHDITNLF